MEKETEEKTKQEKIEDDEDDFLGHWLFGRDS